MCNCGSPEKELSQFQAIQLDSRSNAFSNTTSALSSNDNSIETVLIGNNVDRIHTLSLASANEGNVAITGNIGLLRIEGSVNISIEGGVIALTIQLTSPVKIGPLTWKFNVAGEKLVLAAAPEIQDAQGPSPMGLNFGCIAKCAGSSLLSVVIACLPSLIAGPQAFIACVTSKLAGGDAAKFAECIAKNCS